MKSRNNFFLSIVFFCGLFLSGQAHTALVNVVDHGHYFSDIVNGLDWRDTDDLFGSSYLMVQARLGPDGDLNRLRIIIDSS